MVREYGWCSSSIHRVPYHIGTGTLSSGVYTLPDCGDDPNTYARLISVLPPIMALPIVAVNVNYAEEKGKQKNLEHVHID